MVLCCAICEMIDCVPSVEEIYECPVCKRQYSIYRDENGKLCVEEIRLGGRVRYREGNRNSKGEERR